MMAEYQKDGMALPPSNPWFCRVSRYLLTTDTEIEVQSPQTSGEAEVVACVGTDNRIWITIGSDHCDRHAESFSYNKPKQLCPKVMCPEAWPYVEVENHWDQLTIESSVRVDGKLTPYQQGTASTQLQLLQLLALTDWNKEGLILFCGTIPLVTAKTLYSETFEMNLYDPVLNRRLSHQYHINVVGPRTEP